MYCVYYTNVFGDKWIKKRFFREKSANKLFDKLKENCQAIIFENTKTKETKTYLD